MPNHKLTPRLRQAMIQRAVVLCDARVAVADRGFPLTHDQVQQALVPARVRDDLQALVDIGVESIQKTSEVYGIIEAERAVSRAAAVSIFVKQPVLYLYMLQRSQWDVKDALKRGQPGKAMLDLSAIPDDDMAQLAKWVNHSVRERRIKALTERVVGEFVGCNEHNIRCPSVAHLLARWPTLKVLVQDDQWRARMSDPPAHLDRWGWQRGDRRDLAWYEKHKRAMALAGSFLTSADMLPEYEADTSPVRAVISGWRRLPGDPD